MTLLEVVVALTVTSLLLAVLLGLLAAQVKLARTAAQRVLAADAIRTTTAVLGGELRRATSADVRAFSADSLAIRSFRGIATVCDADAARLIVRFRGDRAPDERKDSVLIVRDDGSVAAAVLVSARSGAGCTANVSDSVLELRTVPHVRSAALVLVFEAGSYYLTNRALRYRLGAEGRQPLTAEAFRDAPTAFTSRSASVIRFDLAPAGAATSPHSAAFGASAPP